MITRVRVPPPICSTNCPHPPSWDIPWVTSEEYLSSLQCVLIRFNGAITRDSGITAVGWMKKMLSVINAQWRVRWNCDTQMYISYHCKCVREYNGLHDLTVTHKSISRVRIPSPIGFTSSTHRPSWDKPWVTSEGYHSSFSCVLVWFNKAIFWNSRITTVCWMKNEKWCTIYVWRHGKSQ